MAANTIWAEDISSISTEGSYRYTYNMTSGSRNELFFSGSHTLNKHFTIDAGFSTAFNALPERFYFRGRLFNAPSFLSYSIHFLYRDFPDYNIKESSINPTVSLLTRFFILELGMSFRILNTDMETASIHTLYRLQFNLINRPVYQLRISMANFDSFHAGNFTDIQYRLSNNLRLSDKLILKADAGFSNSGQISFASFYSAFFGEISVRYIL